MLLLPEVMSQHTDLPAAERAWLQAVVREWHLLADTSFSDLVMWLPDSTDANVFWAGAQLRPNTGPTALEDDLVGESIAYEPDHQVTEAFQAHRICETSDNQLSAGIPVGVWAIPVMRQGRCIAVVERHTNQMGIRAPGALEDCYLEVAGILTDMLWRGIYPVDPPSTMLSSPRVGDGLIRTDANGVVTYASPNALSAYRRLGLVGELEGQVLCEVTETLATCDVIATSLPDAFGRSAEEMSLDLPEASVRLRRLPLSQSDAPVGDVVLCADSTALRDRERQLTTKDAMISEIHHRVKNNLQTVAALLRLQSRRMNSPEAKAALKDAVSRVQSIAIVHEILSQTFDETVRFDQVADQLLSMVQDVAAASGTVTGRREGSFGLVPADVAAALSLAITELCQNAVEHGLASGSGTVTIRPQRDGGRLVVDVVNDGRPLPSDLNLASRTSLGLSIVQTLVSDLGGGFTLGNNPDGSGVTARVTVPITDGR
ncbi:MAG: sensor histidine kinase [Actinomycetia bacterium]|nr:sensor histidine kinase [Actinomycetes bacterium]